MALAASTRDSSQSRRRRTWRGTLAERSKALSHFPSQDGTLAKSACSYTVGRSTVLWAASQP